MKNDWEMIGHILKVNLRFVQSIQLMGCFAVLLATQGCGNEKADNLKEKAAAKADQKGLQSKPVLVELEKVKEGLSKKFWNAQLHFRLRNRCRY